ncbi:MAG: polysaccharide biosynthesis tyrosine autokinase [Myxococcales bacterium]|nr:polysaccharide biosynthesis tyrosine autokinase [Myxococcales bacterium]
MARSAQLASGAPPPRPEDEAAHADVLAQVMRLLAILRRRWLVVVVTTTLCLAAASLAIMLLQPRWKATASVVLHMSGPQVLDKIKGVAEDAEGRVLGYREYYQTQRTIMQSRAVAERALAELGLAKDPVFLGIADVESEAERQMLAEQIDPVERLRELTHVQEVRNSRVVEISAEYPDPDVAAEIANAISDAYIAHVQRSRSRVGEEAKDNISAERDKALHRVQDAEKALEDFKKEHEITSISLSDRQNVITQDILTLSTRAKDAEAERIELQNMLEQAKRLHAAGNLAAANLLPEEDRTLFERLRSEQLDAEQKFNDVDIEYGPKHEEHRKAKRRLDLINARIEREASNLIASLESNLLAARQIERDLGGSMRRENNKALRLGELERGYRELEREATASAEDYLLVARRDTEIAITNRVEAEGIEILDRATVPTGPVFPPKLLLLALGLVSGLGLGALLAISIDFRDHRIRGLLDLERALANFGLPVLGQLPLLPADNRLGLGNVRAQRRQRDLYAHLYPQSLMAERCRGVRTALTFAQGREPVGSIMITSPSSSEGKSSTAINLALSFCQANKKVVLIDADLRRPRIHHIFPGPVENEDLGLAALLTESTELDRALLPAPDDAPDSLTVLPCGSIPGNPAELLDGPAFRRLLGDLRERFDLVIIDSPPVLPVTDPLILAGVADAVVVVTRCDSTTRGELQRALGQLSQADANIMGVILNEVDTRQERYDYGGDYYTYRAPATGSDSA